MNLVKKLLVICLLVLVILASDLAAHEHSDQLAPQLIDKLDKILVTLESLSIKHDELNKTIQQNLSACQSANSDQLEDKNLQKQNKQTTGAPILTDTSIQSDQDDQEILLDRANGQTKGTFKRESRDNDDVVVSKDLFHFNKLATNLNSIASSTSHHQPSSSYISPPASNVANLGNHEKRIILTMSQYDSLFSDGFDNLSSIMKEQLIGFRLTLNKLMNRIMDHNYQHNVLANQLSFVKDECSLAAYYSSSAANYSSMASQQAAASSANSQDVSAPAPVAQDTLRSSDATMIVRLLSQELNTLIQKNLPQLRASSSSADLIASPNVDHEAQEHHEKFESFMERDFKSLRRRVDEIDSIVKQIALMVNKLAPNLPQADSSSNGAKRSPSFTTVICTNSADAVAAPDCQDQTNKWQQQQQQSRWFPGSKVPNKPAKSVGEKVMVANSTTKQQGCQAKTSLIRPTSCRQLRLAGANCTGQYYVFVRGSIRHVYCDMNMDSEDDGGGWTVIMRRIDKSLDQKFNSTHAHQVGSSAATRTTNHLLEAFKAAQVNFNMDWTNYKTGFGHLDAWSEFFIGLDLLHQLTRYSNRQMDNNSSTGQQQLVSTTELQVDLFTSESNELHLRFDNFVVEDETTNYRLQVGSCNSSDTKLCKPILMLNRTKFYTFDKIQQRQDCSNDNFEQVFGGWWHPVGHDCNSVENSSISSFVRLTSPIGRHANGSTSHLYWPDMRPNEPLRQIVLKVRNKRITL